MLVARRPALVLLSCAALAASQVYACGIELDTAPEGDAGTSSSSSSGRTSSGNPTSSSSGEPDGSSGTSSGSSSGITSSSSSGDPPPDAGTCNPVAIAEADLQCPATAGSATFLVADDTVTCAREGAALGGASTLAPDVLAQAGAAWVRHPLTRMDGYVVEATISITAVIALGTGFTLAFVHADDDAGVTPPGVGGYSGAMGVGALSGFSGLAAAAQTYDGLHFRKTAVPGPANNVEGWLTADTSVPIAPPTTYRLVGRHEPGASTISVDVFEGAAVAATANVSLNLDGSAVSERIDYVGVTASTGGSTAGGYTLTSFSVSCLP